MPIRDIIKPTHKPVADYYAAPAAYAQQGVAHESAVRSAFQNLLAHGATRLRWTLIPELSDTPSPAGRLAASNLGPPDSGRGEGSSARSSRPRSSIRPDATLRDEFFMDRGHWEAKDTADDLEAEIAAKIKLGYPLSNIIFEDTRAAHLYQNGQRCMLADLTDKRQLCDLLNTFFGYTEPAHEDFDKAVEDFKLRVPDLAKGLVQKIEQAHRDNRKFQEAFGRFYDLCCSSLNPNLSRPAVDEMLVQHLLTERLIRTIFDNPDFVRRNVIAAEVEKVIDALTGQSFNRADFLRSLDVFYKAIEMAAATLPDFTAKQHFLNTIYERFFQGYCVRTADTHGIVYTPQPIVDFMCASVVEVLKNEFGRDLGDKDVFVLDPCTGTANFVVNLLRRLPKKDLPDAFRGRFFANEVMLMPYYIAALNVEHAYYELTGRYEPFEGLCFVDTLDLTEAKQHSMFTEANTERVQRQKKSPITIVIGNPPYNANQLNENDNNKNRKYRIVDQRIRDTYGRLNSARKPKLGDPYIRFFRSATDRLGARDGIVCLVTNNSFVHQTATDGLQKALPREFNTVYHLDLQGNVRQNPTLSGTAYNVFGIQLGVGITIAVRRSKSDKRRVFYHAVTVDWTRQQKLSWIHETQCVDKVPWVTIKPTKDGRWFQPDGESEFRSLIGLASEAGKASTSGVGLPVIFKTYSLGVSTNRDDVVYDFNRDALLHRVQAFCRAYNGELDRFRRERPTPEKLDDWLDYSRVKWSRNLKSELKRGVELSFNPTAVRWSLYRPFTPQWIYLADVAVDEPGQMRRFFPEVAANDENRVITVPTVGCERGSFTMVSRLVPNLNFVGFGGGAQNVPFYVYDEDGSNRRENITDWALNLFRRHYATKKIDKWDIFHYVYGLLHHPGYRAKFSDCLKKELPRIPLAKTLDEFRGFREAGKELAQLHVGYEQAEPWPLEWVETPGRPLSCRVEKMKLTKDKKAVIVNESLTLRGIPPEVFEYRLGNRSALDWVIDQYQTEKDAAGDVTSDPNRPPPEERYIVDLVAKVVRVSVRTVQIVKALPPDYGRPPRWEGTEGKPGDQETQDPATEKPDSLATKPATSAGKSGQKFTLRPSPGTPKQMRLPK